MGVMWNSNYCNHKSNTIKYKTTMTSTRIPLFVCLLLSISRETWGQPVETVTEPKSWPSCSIAAQPKSSSTNTTTNSPFFGSFLEAYTETVDTIVGLQTTTWNYIARYKTFDESKVEGLCEVMNKAHLRNNIPKFAKFLEEDEEVDTTATTTTTWELPEDYLNDKASDIDGYLTELAEACSKDIKNGTDAYFYQMDCLDRIKDTVYEPRCTSRYDSRVECNGETVPTVLSTPSELISGHFGSSNPEELHVVIVGAGPVGLMLGNALSMLQKTRTEIPPIKILYLETRADAPGFKRAYSRNWQAHLNLLHFRNRMDPRLLKIFGSMTTEKDKLEESTLGFVLPINVIETLLMLSTKDLGAAKFLFGVNPLDIVEDLKDVPNLVLVDTTGHRLEPLRRGSACDIPEEHKDNELCTPEEEEVIMNHRTPPSPTIPWKNPENSEFYDSILTFKQDFTEYHDFVEEHGQHLHVAKQGDLMYPIDESTKVAKSMWWLDIHGAMPLTSRGFQIEINAQTDALFAGEGPFCQFCKDWFKEHDDGRNINNLEDRKTAQKCNSLCYATYYAQSTQLFRDDINSNIFNGKFDDTFVYHTDSWFPLMGYAFNPSSELAAAAEKVLVASGYANDPIGMPLKEFYPALIENLYSGDEDDDEYDDDDYDDDEYDEEEEDDMAGLSESDWALIGALERYSYQSASQTWPKVTLFAQQPFIYTNGIKKKNKCLGKASKNIGDHLEHAPMIRFGDSFTTGDGLNGAGLFTHAAMVGTFMDAILDKSMSFSSTRVS